MQSVRELKREIAGYLQGRSGLEDSRILEAFPAAQRDFPLRKPVVAVGLDSIAAAPEGFGGYWGENGDDLVHGAGAEITLRFDLFLPAGQDGGRVHELYEALCDHLLLRHSPFGIRRMWCGETVYDRVAGVHRMTARAVLHSALLVKEPAGRFDEVTVRRGEMHG